MQLLLHLHQLRVVPLLALLCRLQVALRELEEGLGLLELTPALGRAALRLHARVVQVLPRALVFLRELAVLLRQQLILHAERSHLAAPGRGVDGRMRVDGSGCDGLGLDPSALRRRHLALALALQFGDRLVVLLLARTAHRVEAHVELCLDVSERDARAAALLLVDRVQVRRQAGERALDR